MRPRLRFLEVELIERIIGEARTLLADLGVEIHNEEVLALLADSGVRVDRQKQRAYIPESVVDRALAAAPASFRLYDVDGEEAVDLSGDNVNYTPGSAAIYFLDYDTNERRYPKTADYVRYCRLMRHLRHLRSQSTAMIPHDVDERISDSYRLYLSLLYCPKPVVTGAFSIEGFEVMKDLQLAIRGDAAALKEKPLTIFSCCPTSPIKWSDVTSQNLVDCARWSIPVEYVAMPLSGFMAPVTIVGTLIQHTAETLSGLVISQTVNPGTPVLYGGSPAVFDVRYETTPMGDVGTMMIDCAYNEIGKHLGLPTQAYVGLSDAKTLDAQAGLESSMGATLAALAGINNISGPGMLDFENLLSLEKLVVDNEICGMTYRMLEGIVPRDDFPSMARFEEMLTEGHLLISDHTRKYLKQEIYFPGPVIDRANRPRWIEEGGRSLLKRAHDEVEHLIDLSSEPSLDSGRSSYLKEVMMNAAGAIGIGGLPEVDE